MYHGTIHVLAAAYSIIQIICYSLQTIMYCVYSHSTLAKNSVNKFIGNTHD